MKQMTFRQSEVKSFISFSAIPQITLFIQQAIVKGRKLMSDICE